MQQSMEAEIVKQLTAAGYEIIPGHRITGKISLRPDALFKTSEGKLILIEVKAKKAPVDAVDVIRVAVLRNELKADAAYLITSSYLTPSAKVAASKQSVHVITLTKNMVPEAIVATLPK